MENHQNSEFGSGNNPTGYLLPELQEVSNPDFSPNFRTGRLALGAVLLSTVTLAAEPAYLTNDSHPKNHPVIEAARSPRHVEHRPSHLTKVRAIAAVAIHKVSIDKPPKITAHMASVSSTSPTKRSRPSAVFKEMPVPNYATQLRHPAEAQPVQGGQSGQWIEVDNAPYGYYLGAYNTATDKAIVLATTNQGDYNYLAIKMKRGSSTIDMCGWANNDAVTAGHTKHGIKPVKNTMPYPDCMKQINRLSLFQFSFGHDYNSLNSADGELTDQTPQCDGIQYRNDRALDAITAGASLRYARHIKNPLFDTKAKIDSTAPLFSRYVPLDNKTLVARTDQAGWGILERECARKIPKGGPPNHDRERKKHLAHIH